MIQAIHVYMDMTIICNNATSHKLECLHTFEMMCRNKDTHVTLPYSSLAVVFKSIAMTGLSEMSIAHTYSFDLL